MRARVRIRFGPAEIVAGVPASEPPWSLDASRLWLDDQFTRRECEPLRAMGKVLTADKLLAVAEAIGPDGFHADPALQRYYAQAACALLARADVQVDVDARHVGF